MSRAWPQSLLVCLLSLALGLCLHTPGRAQEPAPAVAEDWAIDPGQAMPGEPVAEAIPPEPGPLRWQWWAESELLLWNVAQGPLPFPVLTRGNPADPIPGALGQPGTQVLFGGEGLDYGQQTGVRLNLGTWFNRYPRLGVEVGGFWLDRQAVTFTANGDAAGNPPTYVPAFRPELGREGSFTISDPLLLLNGSAVFSSQSYLWGAEVNGLFHLRQDARWDISLLSGLRHLILDEDFTFTAYLRDPLLDVNSTLRDVFATENHFFGGQVGTRVRYRLGRFTFDFTGKVAFGLNREEVLIAGSLTQSGIGVPLAGTLPGGLFAQPSNVGTQSETEWVIIPQGTVKLDYEVAPRLHLFAGYDFLWWSSVVRPGDQLDRRINRTQQAGNVLVGPALPAPQFNTTPFWAQGVNVGVSVRY